MSSATAPAISWKDMNSTMMASIRSVGTACTLAAIGVYLHRRGFIVGEGKRTLALIAQQVTIPLFLFTKLVYCNQDWSDDPCPSIMESLHEGWFLLFWPAYVVGSGLLVGHVASCLSNTPKNQRKAVLAACAFGNSTGLPITLLTVVHANFPSTTELGAVDPTLFLSIYLLLYPVLQWGVGGWLLAPDDEQNQAPTEPIMENPPSMVQQSMPPASSAMHRNVLNNNKMEEWYSHSRRGIGETDASMYMTSTDLVQLDEVNASSFVEALPTTFQIPPPPVEQYHPLGVHGSSSTESTQLIATTNQEERAAAAKEFELSTYAMVHKIASRCLQPPVVGAILGLLTAATPLRGLLVDLVDRKDDAPLEWFFDALYAVGQAAVPINMIILGCNLSQSMMGGASISPKTAFLSTGTMIAIVMGKMIVMPIIGVISAVTLKMIQSVPESINASLYLVAMIVFITPTANNVMIMVELSGSGTNEGIARVIAWQYAVAPFILSFSMTLAVGVASQWS
jgi:predicted permease